MPPRGNRTATTVSSPDLLQQQGGTSNDFKKGNNNNNNNRLIAQDHDDEAEDSLLSGLKLGTEHPFVVRDPDPQKTKQLILRDLKDAQTRFRELHTMPAVKIISAPAEPDRAAWRSCIVLGHNDPPPLDLRTNHDGSTGDYYRRLQQDRLRDDALGIISPNAYLLQKERPRWVAISQRKLTSGCPSRGVPVLVTEDPSVVSMREYSKSKSARTGSKNHSHSHQHHHHHHHLGSASSDGNWREGSEGMLSARSQMSGATSNNMSEHHYHYHHQQQQHHGDASKLTLRERRAQEDAAQTARSVGNLLMRMDGIPAGTRDYKRSEHETLRFLRESTKASTSIKAIVAGESNGDIEAAQRPQHLVAKRPAGPMLGSGKKRHGQYFEDQRREQKLKHLHEEQQQKQSLKYKPPQFRQLFQEDDDEAAGGEEFADAEEAKERSQQRRTQLALEMAKNLTFEELTQPLPQRKVGQSALEVLASSAASPPSSSSPAQLLPSIYSARSTKSAPRSDSPVTNPGKVLVRLPKVGLQLFSSVRK